VSRRNEQQECVKEAHQHLKLNRALPNLEHQATGIDNVRRRVVDAEANQANPPPVEDDEGNQFYEF
jgi:hypothetical protein|tara:strand:- start:215 stop:412 length:198 start_codon:yes stop_codon:yes gene_type:complete